eukprot:TRINITY_DN2158_c0_g1_i14.p1 TRINITY_DN2158_c0_g1~~TRINITY_DN2158_c0_g1_i14.p1  ORF type:complete len:203 (+),score=61.98 TRINITY_DN2158_c0_g1_i14:282-890(+)
MSEADIELQPFARTRSTYYGAAAAARAEDDQGELSEASDSEEEAGAEPAWNYDCIDFDDYESEQFLRGQAQTSEQDQIRISLTRWVIIFAIGVLTAMSAFIIDVLVQNLTAAKYQMVDSVLRRSVLQGAITKVVADVILALLASGLVCFVSMAAIGSGIPEVKSRLNGIDMPGTLRLSTYIAKVLGMTCSVSAGLPVVCQQC